jgi:hypothetical protein
LANCRRNQEILSGVNFFENKRFVWRFITPVFLQPFTGPLLKLVVDAKQQKIIADQLNYVQLLLKQLKSDYNLIQLNTFQTFQDLRAFTWNDFLMEPEHTYICSLENENILFNNFNQSLRKKIQKSKEKNLKYVESNDIELFINLYDSSYNRHGKNPPISFGELQSLLKKIIVLPNIHLFFIKKDEKCLAGRIIMEDKDTIYDLLAGNIDETGLASSYLVTEIMKMYVEKFTYFDFMGADHPEIEKFKRAFGGELVHRFKVQGRVGLFLNLLLKIRQKSELARRDI